ncbi:MAG: ABC transporter substrate-binding protein [Tannerella sp.]|jgi:NitT/TauT family transport system substrate-binding protein|nr:ABC transporter substrate-binding protein [Tannerella sp.]
MSEEFKYGGVSGNKARRALGFIIVIALVMSGCGRQGSKTHGASERFPLGEVELPALNGSACAAPAYIAKEKGFFEAEGLDVTLVTGDFETSKAGLASGKFPVANGDFQYFPSVNEGLDIKIIDGLHQGCIKLVVPPSSTIRTAKDLAGLRIGVDEIGGSPMAITAVLLANNGIDPVRGVTWLPFPKDQLITVAEKGEVDAVALWDPFGSIAEKKGYRVICDIGTHPLFAGKYCCFLYASHKQIKQNPTRIAAILKAFHKASEWIAKNPAETARISVAKGYIAADDTAFVGELIESYKYHAKHDASNKSQAKTDAVYFVNELKKAGFLPVEIDTESFVENLYYDILGSHSTAAGQ